MHRFNTMVGAGRDLGYEGCGRRKDAGAAALRAVEGDSQGSAPPVHDGDGVDEEVQIGVAGPAPGTAPARLVSVPREVGA